MGVRIPQLNPAPDPLDGTEPLETVQSGASYRTTAQAIADLALGSGATGTLAVGHGGTGAAALTIHGVLLGQTTGAIHATAAGTNGQTLTGVTGADPAWQTIQAATATNAADAKSAHVRYTAPSSATANAAGAGLVANVDVADGVQILGTQPDYPRKLLLFITDDDSSITLGTLDLVGIGPSGEAATESIALTGGTVTKTSAKAYATLTSATVSNLAGAAAGDKIALGRATALGLPGQKTPAASGFAVYKANVDNANETIGTVDATAGTIVPSTAPNASHNYDFWFTYAVTEFQNSHTHTFA